MVHVTDVGFDHCSPKKKGFILAGHGLNHLIAGDIFVPKWSFK